MTWFRHARRSFWFLPALLCTGALVIAQLTVWTDRTLSPGTVGTFDFLLFQVGASGGRDILVAIGGSMLAVAATSFSVTIMVLATASATYGPRLVRNFMTDRRNQLVLGTFGATFLYSLMVLRTIRSADAPGGAFVPEISINLAVLFAIIDVAVLVYFIHHIADSIQVSTLSNRVRGELAGVVRRMRPAKVSAHAVYDPQVPQDSYGSVTTGATGVVQRIGHSPLVALAANHDAVIELLVSPGTHRIPGETIASVWPADKAKLLAGKVREQVVLGDDRTPEQDIGFAVQQLTEMAVRALSPSMNDPYTARNALQGLAAGLVPLCERPDPGRGRADREGRLRLICPAVEPADLVNPVFDAVRNYAMAHPIVLLAALDLAGRIGQRTHQQETKTALLIQVDLIANMYAASEPPTVDKDRVLARAEAARQLCKRGTA